MAITKFGLVGQRIKSIRRSRNTRNLKLRRMARRNPVLLVTLLVVGALVAILTGFAGAMGSWYPPYWDLSAPPAPRFGQASTYDGARDRVVVFGGFVSGTNPNSPASLGGPPISNNNQTYLYQADWQRRDPLTSPSVRGYAAMAYDGARKNVVLFGGGLYNSNTVRGDTWTWDGEDWTLQNPPAPVPDPRQNAAMVYDPHRKEVLMFGGRDANGKPMNDTWVWNGEFWKIKPPEGAPSPRHSAALAYDTCRAEAVMFGGVGDPINSFHRAPSETWTWDGSNWTPKAPRISPPARVGGHLAYSDRTGNVLLYGGLITNDAGVPTAAADHDLWRWVPEDPVGVIPDGPTSQGLWERMNAESGPAENVILAVGLGDGIIRSQPPPRAYATWQHVSGNSLGSTFFLFGGTPAAGANGAQFAYSDSFFYGDKGLAGGVIDERSSTGNPQDEQLNSPREPLIRECADPIPVSEDDPSQSTFSGPQFAAREGMREIDQLPVLTGNDWPQSNRNTHVGSGQNQTPNPNHTAPPHCPNPASGVNGSTTQLFTDGKRNRIYQFFPCDPARGTTWNGQTLQTLPPVHRILIEAYDGNTLEPVSRVTLETANAIGVNVTDDSERGRFLLKDSGPALLILSKDLIDKGQNPFAGKKIDLTGAPPFLMFDTLFYHPKTGLPKMFYFIGPEPAVNLGPPPSQGLPQQLALWDLEAKKEDWRMPLTGCVPPDSGSSGGYQPTAMHLGNRAYAVCSFGSNRYGAVRISLTEKADGSETPTAVEGFSGPYFVADTWADPQAERMVLHARDTNNSGAAIWVFDGKVSRWVGRVGMGRASTRWGFDREAGRLYAHLEDNAYGNTRGGVRIVDTRLTPVSQSLEFPQFASPPAVSVASLPSGPGVPRRVFTRVAGGMMKKHPNWETVEFKNQMYYTVLADEMPIPKNTELAELDALTVPVIENPSKTEVSFDAEGSGYGMRLRSVGGIWTVARPSPSLYEIGGNGGVLLEGGFQGAGRPFLPACLWPDRELMAGWVPQARLSELDALARSAGLEVDSSSKVDLTGPVSRCTPTADASNFPPSIKVVFDVLWPLWQMVQFEGNQIASSGVTAQAGQQSGETTEQLDTPAGTVEVFKDKDGKPTGAKASTTTSAWDSHFKTVECVGDALKTYQASVGNIYGSANCVQQEGRVEATAKGSATGVGPAAEATSSAFSVGEGTSKVTVTRDPVRGVVVTSTALATGIRIGPLSIDRVETRAEAWSNGRPGEERASFVRYICGVHDPESRVPNGCLTSAQQKQFVENWNRGGSKNSQMYLPEYDPELYRGSPGGYIAGVIKPVAVEIEDQLFARDYLREVPGLEIVFFKESLSFGNARQSLQLAAVRAVAGFGVQCNPDYLYSPQTNTTPATCVLIPEDLPEEEYFEEGEDEFFEEEESELDGEWISADALGPTGPSLGSRIGRLLENLPVIRQLPIRQIAEALLAGSVWWLLGLPLFLASRRFALSQWRTN